jgi:DMSO/TMAO reductase YedYZ molybdopterin-dependent catalytic subunit
VPKPQDKQRWPVSKALLHSRRRGDTCPRRNDASGLSRRQKHLSATHVTGLVSKTATLSVSDLKKMPATTVTATQRTNTKRRGTHRYTGVLRNRVIQAAIPISNTSFKNDPIT